MHIPLPSDLSLDENILKYEQHLKSSQYQEAISQAYVIASQLLSAGLIDSAGMYYDKIIEVSSLANNAFQMADAAGAKGELLYMQEKYYQALDYYKVAGAYYSKAAIVDSDAHTDVQIGNCFGNIGKLDSSIFYLERGLKKALKHDLEKVKPLAYNGLAVIYQEAGAYEKAFEMYLNAMQVMEANKDTVLLVGLLHNVSYFFLQQGDLNQAEVFANNAYEMAKKKNLTGHQIHALNMLANVLAEKGELEKALSNYQDILTYFYQKNKMKRAANVHQLMGKTYLKQKKYEVAEANFETAIQLYQEVNSPFGLVSTRVALAQLHIELNQNSKARNLLKESESLAIAIGDKPDQAEVL